MFYQAHQFFKQFFNFSVNCLGSYYRHLKSTYSMPNSVLSASDVLNDLIYQQSWALWALILFG